MTEVTCNECDIDFELPKLRRAVLKGLAYEFFFHCPECNHKYISYYTNAVIRRDIKRQEKRWKKYQQMVSGQAERKLLAEINMNDKLIERDMDALKIKMQKEVV